jgi:chloramphenicol 3-O-phosphotransferase
MKLVFLHGPPGVGKLTVARELAAITGYKLFHNHLVVDALLAVFEFGSPAFVELREAIWLSVFERAGRAGVPGLIFTFAPEKTVRPGFIAEVSAVIAKGGDDVRFVALTCAPHILKTRLDTPSRRETGKLTSAAQFEQLAAAGNCVAPDTPRPHLSIDTGRLPPTEAARQIAESLTAEGFVPSA